MMLLPSGLPVLVGDDEVLARHVFTVNKRDLREGKKGVLTAKASVFMPQPSPEGWVRSVSRTREMPDDEAIQRDGQGVGQIGVPPRVLYASAQLYAREVRKVEVKNKAGSVLGHMDVVPEEPPPYHAHLVNYPDLIDGENPKELQKDCAQNLADKVHRIFLRTVPWEQWEVDAEGARKAGN